MIAETHEQDRGRSILHIDMDAYFAEIEVLCNPRLRGKPLIIGGCPGDRGVVATASYEARVFGIKAGMSLTKARKLCPDAIFMATDGSKYQSFSLRILKYLLEITPRVEMWSIDEAFLDLSDMIDPASDRFTMPVPCSNNGSTLRPVRETALFRIASSIRDSIMKEFHLTCSIGGGPNKLIAKMATGLHKPRGLTLLSPNAYRQTFWPRPVEDLMGVGRKTGDFLHRLGFPTIGDLAVADPRLLARVMGVVADHLVSGARGEEGSPVIPFADAAPPKSLGHEHTVSSDLTQEHEVEALLLALCDEVGFDMRQGGYLGRTVVLKMRTRSFETMTRQRSLAQPTNENRVIYSVCRDLFREHAPRQPIRLLGVKMGNLTAEASFPRGFTAGDPLLPTDRKYQRLLQTLDHVKKEYGPSSLFRAATMAGKVK